MSNSDIMVPKFISSLLGATHFTKDVYKVSQILCLLRNLRKLRFPIVSALQIMWTVMTGIPGVTVVVFHGVSLNCPG